MKIVFLLNNFKRNENKPSLKHTMPEIGMRYILVCCISIIVANQHEIKGEEDFEITIRNYQGNYLNNFEISLYKTPLHI